MAFHNMINSTKYLITVEKLKLICLKQADMNRNDEQNNLRNIFPIMVLIQHKYILISQSLEQCM